MPHKPVDKILKVPDWVKRISDPCLANIVTEALVARNAAVIGGAEGHKECRAVLRSADQTLDAVEAGHGDACRKASTALRKYNTAAECAHPTAMRGSKR